MNPTLQTAIALRKQGEHEKSRQLLKTLANDPAFAGRAALHIAWSYDNESKEREAAEWYLAALEGELEDDEKFEARFGLASTWRCLGKYAQAKALFEEVLADWPRATEVQPFYALCLFNLGETERAVQLLLEHIAHSPNARTAPYKEVLHAYAQNPKQRW